MASTLQQAVTNIQFNDYAARTLLALALPACRLLFFLVVMLSAVGYDCSA